MWAVFIYFIRTALFDLYELLEDLYVWLFAGASRPYVPAIADLFSTLQTYGIVILANGAILILWARYNQYRYGGLDQRSTPGLVSVADLASRYSLPADDVARWQAARILVMSHGEGGVIGEVTTRDPRG